MLMELTCTILKNISAQKMLCACAANGVPLLVKIQTYRDSSPNIIETYGPYGLLLPSSSLSKSHKNN